MNKSRAEYMRKWRANKKHNNKNQTYEMDENRLNAINNIPDDEINTIDENDENNEDQNLNEAYNAYINQRNQTIEEGTKSLEFDDSVNDLHEYLQTSDLVNEIKILHDELQQTRAILEKTNELVKILNDELMDKHKQIKSLKQSNNKPKDNKWIIANDEDLIKYFHHNKHKFLDKNEDVQLDEANLSEQQFNKLKTMLEEFENEFMEQLKQSLQQQ